VKHRLLLPLARLGVALATLATLALPTVTFVYVRDWVQVGARARDITPPPPLAAPARDLFAAFAHQPATSVVVLGYHDVIAEHRTDVRPGRRLSVAAQDLGAHLRMLRTAGFTAVTARQVSDYVARGTQLPAHPVLLTFDGARVRDWTYADRLLQEYGFTATVFVDPTTVDTATRRASLSWAKLRAMAATGRWSVGILPATLAAPVVVDESGTLGSGILSRRYLGDARRSETGAEFTTRLRDGLATDAGRLAREGLPAPVLLAYPFQPGYPLTRGGFDTLSAVTNEVFPAAVLTVSPDEAAGPSWTARRILPRLEVYESTTDDLLFARIRDAVAA
jgi:hypothetical protein